MLFLYTTFGRTKLIIAGATIVLGLWAMLFSAAISSCRTCRQGTKMLYGESLNCNRRRTSQETARRRCWRG